MQYRLYGDDGINESITIVNDIDDDTIALFPWMLIAGILTSVSFAKMPQLIIPCSVMLPLTVTFCLPGVTTSLVMLGDALKGLKKTLNTSIAL
jgi:hypothetical protein